MPEGYSYDVILPFGTELLGGSEDFSIHSTGEQQAMQIGSHHDGLHFFPIDSPELGEGPFEGSSDEGLLVMNHEYIEPRFMHAHLIETETSRSGVILENGGRNPDHVLKELNAHGVSVAHIRRNGNKWSLVPDSTYSRRITGLTHMELRGPVRGHNLVKTKYSNQGHATRGTLNNCAHGVTPWNTYMAAEENWAGYFGNADATLPREHQRYGIRAKDSRYSWALATGGDTEERFSRFDASSKGASALEDYRNEPNCFGWMVEIDPFDPTSTPQKRTTLGRFAHEGVVFAPGIDGQPVVCYSGDDSTNEYIYKFVSDEPYLHGVTRGEILDKGTLYVARFNDDGTGEWLALAHGQNGLTAANGFADEAEVLVNTRLAADFVGATPMDRPEWGAVDPKNGDVYFTLTNNSGRTETNAANPRQENRHGHIIRWAEADGNHAAMTFDWDIFVKGGDGGTSGLEHLAGEDPNGQPLTWENIFSSPDGLWIDRDSRVWIQIDISEGSQNDNPLFSMFGNNSMFCADPDTGIMRRFLTGPTGQEITGVITTPDQKYMFINVQHPGATTSPEQWARGEIRGQWPNAKADGVPRSATVVIWKDDGGVIGT